MNLFELSGNCYHLDAFQIVQQAFRLRPVRIPLQGPADSPPATPTSAIPKNYPGCTQTPTLQQLTAQSSSGCSAGIRSTAYHPPSTSSRSTALTQSKLPIQFSKVRRHPLPNLAPESLPLPRKPRRHRPLHRRIHRQKRIGNHLQPLHRLRPASGPVATIHAAFICGKPRNLAHPAHHKTSTPFGPAGKTQPAPPAESVVQKHLVHNQRQPMLPANRCQFLRLPSLREMPRRIVRMHHHNRPRRGVIALQIPPDRSATRGHRPAVRPSAAHRPDPPENQTADSSAAAPAPRPPHRTAAETDTCTPRSYWSSAPPDPAQPPRHDPA